VFISTIHYEKSVRPGNRVVAVFVCLQFLFRVFVFRQKNDVIYLPTPIPHSLNLRGCRLPDMIRSSPQKMTFPFSCGVSISGS